MTKDNLKTLKDIEENSKIYGSWIDEPTNSLYYRDDEVEDIFNSIKVEAINWYKELKECENNTSEWIKHFFNIDEENLK